MKLTVRKGVFAVIVAIFAVVSFFPVVWIFLTSIKTSREIYAFPVVYLPSVVTFHNYVEAFTKNSLARFVLNSVIVGSVSTLITVSLSCLAAYGLSRFRVRHSLLMLFIILGFSTFPYMASVIPLFEFFRRVHLLNTYFSLILPYVAFNIPMSVWLSTAYFREVPTEIEDAAKIDGSSRLGALWNIFLPLVSPVLTTVSIIVFITCWNEFLFALTMISRASMRTVPAGIALYPGEHNFPWDTISAAACIAIAPIVVFIAVFQRRIIAGLTAGALKY